MPLILNTDLESYYQNSPELQVNKNVDVTSVQDQQRPEPVKSDSNFEHQIPYEISRDFLQEVAHQIPYEPKPVEDTPDKDSLYKKILSVSDGRHDSGDNSELNIDLEPQIVDYILNTNSKGFTPNMNQSQFAIDSSELGPNNKDANYFSDEVAIGFQRRMSTSLFDPLASSLGPNNSDVNYFSDVNSMGFTRNMVESLYDVKSSSLGPNNRTANYFSDDNATGFTRNVLPLVTLYDVNSSLLGPNNGTANYFSDDNAIGFIRNVIPLVTLYDVNSSDLGPNNGTANYFADTNATGFTRNVLPLITLYDVNSSTLGPNNGTANYFADTNASGYTRNFTGPPTKYNVDSSDLGPNEGSVNYFIDQHGEGFIREMKSTLLKPDSSDLGPNDGSTNYFSDDHAPGFTRNFLETLYKHESSQFVWVGKTAPSVNYFSDINAKGFTNNMIESNLIQSTSDLRIKFEPQSVNFFSDQLVKGFTPNSITSEFDANKSTFSLSQAGDQVNFFDDRFNIGFTKNKIESTLRPDATDFGWGGGGGKAPEAGNFTKFIVETMLDFSNSNLSRVKIPDAYGIPASQNSPLQKFATTRRSPSPIDDQYQKYNLRDDAFNPDYIRQPHILRGFQRKGEYEPQRWGGFAEVDGLSDISPLGYLDIKLAAIERSVKQRLSGRGLLDIISQTGLQRMNPAVEVVSGPLDTTGGRPTWIYNPLSTIRGGNRHGLSLLGFNADGKYEDVIIPKNNNTPETTLGSFSGVDQPNNRLVTLYDELFDAPVLSDPISVRVFGEQGKLGFLGTFANNVIEATAESIFPNIFSKDRIQSLSVNMGGPDSIMGIGPTIIRRYVNSRNSSIKGYQAYIYDSQYASGTHTALSKTKNSDTVKSTKFDVPTDKINASNTDLANQYRDILERDKFTNDADSPIHIHDGVGDNKILSTGADPLKKYITLAYGEIPNDRRTTRGDKFLDFRRLIKDQQNGDPDLADSINGNIDDLKFNDYESQNIHSKNRRWFPDFGKLGQERDDRLKNPKDKSKQLAWEGGNPINLRIGGIKFKALNLAFSDSLSHGWDSLRLLGRADPMYIYNSLERSGTVSFIVVIESSAELDTEIRKLQALYSVSSPHYTGSPSGNPTPQNPSGLINAPITYLQIGSMMKENIAIDSVSYTFDDDMSWEIEGAELPRKISISLSYKVLNKVANTQRFVTDAEGNVTTEESYTYNHWKSK